MYRVTLTYLEMLDISNFHFKKWKAYSYDKCTLNQQKQFIMRLFEVITLELRWLTLALQRGIGVTLMTRGGQNGPTKWIVFTNQQESFQYLIYFFHIMHYIRKTMTQKFITLFYSFCVIIFQSGTPYENVVQYYVRIYPPNVRILQIT